MEIRGTNLDYLDVTIINNNNKIEFDWFHKPTFSHTQGDTSISYLPTRLPIRKDR